MMIVMIIKEFVISDERIILIKVLRKKKELRKNNEWKMFYVLYFLFIFLRIVKLLSILYFHSQGYSCWFILFQQLRTILGLMLRVGSLEGSSWREKYSRNPCYLVYPDSKPEWKFSSFIFPMSINYTVFLWK